MTWYSNPMNASDLRSYMERDWSLVRTTKEHYWAEHGADPQAAWSLADELRQHVRDLRPDWPSDAAREEDLAVHARVAADLRRVRLR